MYEHIDSELPATTCRQPIHQPQANFCYSYTLPRLLDLTNIGLSEVSNWSCSLLLSWRGGNFTHSHLFAALHIRIMKQLSGALRGIQNFSCHYTIDYRDRWRQCSEVRIIITDVTKISRLKNQSTVLDISSTRIRILSLIQTLTINITKLNPAFSVSL